MNSNRRFWISFLRMPKHRTFFATLIGINGSTLRVFHPNQSSIRLLSSAFMNWRGSGRLSPRPRLGPRKLIWRVSFLTSWLFFLSRSCLLRSPWLLTYGVWWGESTDFWTAPMWKCWTCTSRWVLKLAMKVLSHRLSTFSERLAEWNLFALCKSLRVLVSLRMMISYSISCCSHAIRYRALQRVDSQVAFETFEKYKEFYHPICRAMVEKDLFGKERLWERYYQQSWFCLDLFVSCTSVHSAQVSKGSIFFEWHAIRIPFNGEQWINFNTSWNRILWMQHMLCLHKNLMRIRESVPIVELSVMIE